MATRRPRLSGIVCLQCESRLFHTTVQRRLPRIAAPAVLPQADRQTQTWAQRRPPASANHLPQQYGTSSRFHSGRALRATSNQQPSSFNDIPLTTADADFADERPDEKISDDDAEKIWQALLGEEGEPTAAEVLSYIDELRPTDETILSETAFSKSARELADGFTVAQLQAYIRKYRKPASQLTVYPWEARRRPWVPDTYGDDAIVDSKIKAVGPGSSLLLKGYIQTSMTNKERVVVQLMRECWGVSKRELREVPGQLDVTVKDLEFHLLTVGAQTWLRDISTAYSTVTTTTATTNRSRSRSHSRSQTRLHRHIELLPARQKLRVFAPASTADAILAEINGMLRAAKTSEFEIASVTQLDSAITPAVLNAVGTLTGSWVRLNDDGTKGLVSWVAPPAANSNENLEDTGDMVYRLLRRAFGPPGLSSGNAASVLDYVPLARSEAQFLTETDDASREMWPWEHRQGKWARLIEPAPLDASTARQRLEDTTTEPSEEALPMELTLPTATIADDETSQKWYETSKTSTVATFGRVLHAQPSSQSTGLLFTPKDATDDAVSPLPDVARILSPTVPPLLSLSSLTSTPTPTTADAAATPATEEATEEKTITTPFPTTTSTTIVLRFLPEPKTAPATRAPPLEVFLDAVPGWEPILTGLHVITATNTTDVLFPTQPVDVRVTQKEFFALSGAEATTTGGFKPLFAFLDKSRLKLSDNQTGTSVVATPLRLEELALPSEVLIRGGKSDKVAKKRQVKIDYVFAGLEVRRKVATAFEGWTAALTSVEAGRGDGRWTEMSLEAVPAPATAESEGQSSEAAHTKESFRRAVGHMVHGDRVQWVMRHRQVA